MLRPYDAIIHGSQPSKSLSSPQRVVCPLCPLKKSHDAPKYYVAGKGLREHLNAKHGDVDLESRIKVLLEAQRVDYVMSSSQRELHPGLKAAKLGDFELLEKLYLSGEWHSSVVDHHGSTALLWASGSGHLRIVKWLIEVVQMDPLSRIERASQARKDGKTALHWAARNGHIPIMDYFISDLGLNVDLEMSDKSTPLMLACFGGHLEAMEWLNRNKANLSHLNAHGCDCVHWAAMGGHVPILKWLDEQGLPLNRVQNEQQTPLHKAAAKRHLEAHQFLMSRYTENDIQIRDTSGFTALQLLEAQISN